MFGGSGGVDVVDEVQKLDTLVVATAAGSRQAFDALYGMTSSKVLGLVRRVVRDPAQSEEVAQEVFLEIWQTASRFRRDRGKASTWIFTMAHRRAIDRVRASQASRDRDLRSGMRHWDPPFDPVTERAEIVSESARVRRAMESLSALQRDAIALCYLEGRTSAEVAALRGVPVGTVKTRLRDGLIRLRQLLDDPAAAS